MDGLRINHLRYPFQKGVSFFSRMYNITRMGDRFIRRGNAKGALPSCSWTIRGVKGEGKPSKEARAFRALLGL